MSNFSYGVIGLGKVGFAFSKKIAEKGQLKWVITSKDPNSLGFGDDVIIYRTVEQIDYPVSVIAVATGDGAFSKIVRELSVIAKEKHICDYIFHFSGATSRDILAELKQYGIKVMSLHPMQTFGIYCEDIFQDIFWGCDCEREDFAVAQNIIADVGGKAYLLSDEILQNKPLYHAIGVSASNFMQGIIEFTRVQCKNLNLPASDLLLPILRRAYENSVASILQDSDVPITGPVARGDVERIANHLQSFQKAGKFQDEYAMLTKFLATLLFNQGKLDEDKYKNISKLCDEE